MGIPNVKKVHLGRKIERIRELKGMKQETLASILGVSQQTVSRIEQSEEVDEEKLNQIALALEVPPDVIRNFSEEAAIFNIQHNTDASSNNTIVNYQFNPIEKIVALYDDKVALLERLLKEKDEVIEMYKKQQKAS